MGEALEDLAAALAAGDPAGVRSAATVADLEGALQLLAAAAAGGSSIAVEVLLERLDEAGVARRMVRAALLEESAVDDVTQDVLISAAAGISRFRGEAKVTTWLHTIVRHRVVDHLRRQRATLPLPADDLGPGARMSSLLATRATVQAVLAGLPELYRAPVTLRDVDGLPYQEIAHVLGRSEGTVKAQISRGRALVAAALRGQPDSDGLA